MRAQDKELEECLCKWDKDGGHQFAATAKAYLQKLRCFTCDDLKLLKEQDFDGLKVPVVPRRRLVKIIISADLKGKKGGRGKNAGKETAQDTATDHTRKERCVISYRTVDTAKRDEMIQFVEELGFEAWHGAQVKAASENWMKQWIDKVEDDDTTVVLFLLSKAFMDSDACIKEFQWVFTHPNLSKKAVPIMLENFELPKDIMFHLVGCNFVHGYGGEGTWEESLEDAMQEKMRTPPSHGKQAEESFEDMLVRESDALRDEAKEALKGHADHVRLVGVIGSTNFKFSKVPALTKSVCEHLGRKLASVAIRTGTNDEKTLRLSLVTGGCSGVGAMTAKAFHLCRTQPADKGGLGLPTKSTATFAVLPETDPSILTVVNSPLARIVGEERKNYYMPNADGSDLATRPPERPSSAASGRSSGSRGRRDRSHVFGVWPEEEFGFTKHIGKTDKHRKRFLAEALPFIIFIEGGPGATFEAISALSKGHIVLPLGCLGGAASKFVSEYGSKIKKLMKQSKEFEQIKSLFDVLQTCRVESGGLAPMQEEGEGESSDTPVLTVDELTNKVVELLEIILSSNEWVGDQGIASLADDVQPFDLIEEWKKLPEPKKAPLTVLEIDSGEALAKFIDAYSGTPGLKWENKGADKPAKGKEIKSTRLAMALQKPKLQFANVELEAFKVPDLTYDSYIKVKDEYFTPVPAGVAVLIDGHGTKNQYKDLLTLEDFDRKLGPVVEHLNRLYGKDKWVALYGGDPYDPDKCVDTAFIVHSLHFTFGVKIIATQADVYGQYIVTMEASGMEASGLEWKCVGSKKPDKVTDIKDEVLEALLKQRQEENEASENDAGWGPTPVIRFTQSERNTVKLDKIPADSFIKVGDLYFQPAVDEKNPKKMTLNKAYSCLNGGAVMLYTTEFRNNLAGDKEIMYGGLDAKNQYCGASALWFHEAVEPKVKAHLVMGGGIIAQQNAKICLDKHKRVLYIPCTAKIVLEDQQRQGEEWYGQVHSFMEDKSLQGYLSQECWCKILVAPAQSHVHTSQEPKLSRTLNAARIWRQAAAASKGITTPREVAKTSILHQLLPFIELIK